MPDIPEPRRSGTTYVCTEGGRHWAEHACGRPFIFRKSYERHWLSDHGPTPPVDEIPEPTVPLGHPAYPLSADPRLQPGGDLWRQEREGRWTPPEEPVPFTEVDRKEATARLDAYLEQTELRMPRGIGKSRAAGFEINLDRVSPEVIGILTGGLQWNPDAQEYQRAHNVTYVPVTAGADIEYTGYHVCTVCELVTIDPPPLPCPGPRKDTH